MRVLVVEDDVTTASLIERALREEGYAVVVEGDGLAAVEMARSNAFDVLVLDVMLPGLDGFKVVHRLRQQGCETPILMLTARDTDSDMIRGLNLGADDYLSKPFSLNIFYARLRAIARRGRAPLALVLSADELTINTATREVSRKGKAIHLTRTEYGILEVLIRNAGRVVPREQIIENVWGFDAEVGSTNLDAFVHLLRTKVDYRGEPGMIHTVRGIGYTIRRNSG